MKAFKFLLIIALAAGITSCCGCRKGKSKNATPFTGTEWQLVQIDGESITAAEGQYTLRFSEDGKISGRGDCNNLMSGYAFGEGNSITLQGVASTRMMCPNQARETQFVNNLGQIDSYTVDGNMLMLFSKGETSLVFVAR